MEQTKRRVTVPVPAEELKRADPLAVLQERARREGRELPLTKPLSPRAQSIFILAIAALLGGVSVAMILVGKDATPGWILLGCSIAIVAAFVWASLGGEVDAAGSTTLSLPGANSESGNAVILPSSQTIASVQRRMVARLIDVAIVVALLVGASLLIDDRQPVVLVAVAAAILFLLPGLVLWLTNGSSPGKRIVGIRVIRTDGHPMTFGRALKRELGAIASLNVIHGILSVSTLFSDQLGRTPADLSAETIVVRDPALPDDR